MEIDAKVVKALAQFEEEVRDQEGNFHVGYSWDEPDHEKRVEAARLALYTHIARVVQEAKNG